MNDIEGHIAIPRPYTSVCVCVPCCSLVQGGALEKPEREFMCVSQKCLPEAKSGGGKEKKPREKKEWALSISPAHSASLPFVVLLEI